jgi:arylsulfatase A-like enzyme
MLRYFPSTFLALLVLAASALASAAEKPNFILIFADDLGYQDLSCYGAPKIRTPRIDRLASQGLKFTSFYAQTVCGPSRAALMTGCYPLRVAKRKNQMDVHPYLHTKEITIAEVLKPLGYATACFGKWDLAGHRQVGYDQKLLPTRQGFDYFFGTPTSNDGLVNLLRNETMIEKRADMNTLTRRYTDEAIKFLQANKEKPFFIYVPHTMPHTLLGASKEFRGKSKQGFYGDVIEEIDANVGRLVDAVKEAGLEKQTYVFFMSDNGPWLLRKSHGGSALPLRGAKTSTWDGGLRVPCVMWAPGRISPGRVTDEVASTMDMLPTLARLAGGKVPGDRILDGRDITALLHATDEEELAKPRPFYYYQHTHLQAVRYGKWKLHVPRAAQPAWAPRWGGHIHAKDVIAIKTPMLIDLDSDIGEQIDVAAKHPKVVAQLLALIEAGRKDIGDYNRTGEGARFYDPQPRRPDAVKWLKK